MVSTLDLLVAAGRGDDPSAMGGIAIVIGIAVVVLLAGFLLYQIWGRVGRARHDARRRPHKPGDVGRTSEFRR